MADDSVVKDVGALLAANGFGTVTVDIFEGLLPSGKSTCVVLYETRGLNPVRTSAKTIATERPGLMVHVKNPDYETGFQKAQAIRRFLQNFKGLAGTGTYLDMTAAGTVNPMGRLETGEFMFSVNFMLMRVPQ